MPANPQKRFWPICRKLFRWFRILCLLLVLALVCTVIYVTQVGLPEFVKTRLVSELRVRGVDLEFQRMRVHWFRGIVAEKVSLGRRDQPTGPKFSGEEITLKLNDDALKSLKLQVDSLLIRQGKVIVPLVTTNQAPEKWIAENITADLNFLPDDQWELAHFQATTMGMNISVLGSIAHASHLRDIKPPTPPGGTNGPPAKPHAPWQEQLRKINDVIKQMSFSETPEWKIIFSGDALDTRNFSGNVHFHASGAQTPWGTLQNCSLTIPLNPTPTTNGLYQASVLLEFDHANTKWAQAREGKLTLLLTQPLTNKVPMTAAWELNLRGARSEYGKAELQNITASGFTERTTNEADRVHTTLNLRSQAFRTEWVRAQDCLLDVELVQRLTNAPPELFTWSLLIDAPQSQWGRAKRATLTGHVTPAPTNSLAQVTPDWGAWGKFAPFRFDWVLNLKDAVSDKPDFRLKELYCAGDWQAPRLELTKMHSLLYDGQLDLSATLNVATREVMPELYANIDIHKLDQLLGPDTQKWLSDYQWKEAPMVRAQARLTLPPWTEKKPDWEKAILPGLQLKGNFVVHEGSYRGVTFNSAVSDITMTNQVVDLPNLFVKRPEGEATVHYTDDSTTHNYHFGINSTVDVKVARNFLGGEKEKKIFDDFSFPTPPQIKADIYGTWRKPEATGVSAWLQLTNFNYHGNDCAGLTATLWLTNNYINVSNVTIHIGGGELSAPAVGLDLTRELVFVTNGVSKYVDPMVATRVIGPMTAKAIEPYHFDKPPYVTINGMVPFQDAETTDLHFEVQGGPFNYWRFNLPQVTASVHWVTNTLMLTNVQGDFHGGKVVGDAFFNFAVKEGSDYRFHAIVTGGNLHTLVADLHQTTNTLEGVVDCDLTITSANSTTFDTWNGYGTAKLQDGFLWDIPLFGFLTPVLNGISPGLGKSRVSQGTGTYTITNSLIYTKDLELRAKTMRLQYKGTVDFDGHVNARVEAEPFRDSNPLMQPFRIPLMPFTKLFEYKVTGTLGEPKSEPLYLLPKIFLAPFAPFKTLKSLFESDSSDSTKPKEPPADSPKKE